MFHLLFQLSFSYEKGVAVSLGQANKRNRTVKIAFPSICTTFNYDLSRSLPKDFDLVANVPICVAVYGSIFVNGEDIKLTGYVDGVKTVEGYGVFASLASSENRNECCFAIQSSKSQKITVVGDLALGERMTYITTKSNLEEFNIFEKNTLINNVYLTDFLALGKKTSISITVDTALLATGTLQFSNSEEYKLQYYTKNVYQASEADYIISSIGSTSDSGTHVTLTSNGDDWKTPLNGFITPEENHIYTESDFYNPDDSLLTTAQIVVIIVAAVVIIVGIIIYCCCCKKSRPQENKENPPQSSNNDSPQEFYGVESQYTPQPPVDNPEQTPTYAIPPQNGMAPQQGCVASPPPYQPSPYKDQGPYGQVKYG